MKTNFLFLTLCLASFIASSQETNNIAYWIKNSDFKSIAGGNVKVEFMLSVPLADDYAEQSKMLAEENAPILSIVFDNEMVTIVLNAQSSLDRNAWAKIFGTMGIEKFEVDTGEKLGIAEFDLNELLDYYKHP